MSVSKRASLNRRFSRARRGTAAIEFAFIAPVFLGLVFVIMEVGWFYAVTSTLDVAAMDAMRAIRTGQAQQSSQTKEGYFAAVCDKLDMFIPCDEQNTTLTVDVQNFTSWSALAADTSAPVCSDAGDEEKNNIPYEPGGELSIVRIRLCLIFKTVNPALGLNLANVEGDKRKLVSNVIFRNEPYERNNRD